MDLKLISKLNHADLDYNGEDILFDRTISSGVLNYLFSFDFWAESMGSGLVSSTSKLLSQKTITEKYIADITSAIQFDIGNLGLQINTLEVNIVDSEKLQILLSIKDTQGGSTTNEIEVFI